MSAARSVLVLTHRFDPTADKVVEELNNRDVPLFRCDASDFPEQLSVGAELTDGRWTQWPCFKLSVGRCCVGGSGFVVGG